MNNTLTLSHKHLLILQDIFASHSNAYVFGSRAKGTAKEFSDLDVCFIREKPTSDVEISLIREKCEESNLPFVVDIIDYHQISKSFQQIVEKDKVPFPYK